MPGYRYFAGMRCTVNTWMEKRLLNGRDRGALAVDGHYVKLVETWHFTRL
jgi:hypothetical protein